MIFTAPGYKKKQQTHTQTQNNPGAVSRRIALMRTFSISILNANLKKKKPSLKIGLVFVLLFLNHSRKYFLRYGNPTWFIFFNSSPWTVLKYEGRCAGKAVLQNSGSNA